MSSAENFTEEIKNVQATENPEITIASYIEQCLGYDGVAIDGDIDKIDLKLQEIGYKDQDLEKTFRERLEHKLKKYGRILSVAAGLTVVGIATNYEKTRYGITEVNEGSSVRYSHEDQETTQIIEYLSGKKDLDRAVKFNLAKAEIVDWLRDGIKIDIPLGMENLSELEFQKVALKLLEGREDDCGAKIAELQNDSWIDNIVTYYSDNDGGIYKALWEIENISGSPRIRWKLSDQSYVRSLVSGSTSRPYYNPVNNTMYISRSTGVSDILAEAAHATQFRKMPITSILKSLKTGVEAIRSRDYDATYKIQGTLEHDAHSVIEPQLHKKFDEVWRGLPQGEEVVK